MLKAFKFRLYPSRSQVRLLEQTLETCRQWDTSPMHPGAGNTCLEERKTAWAERHESVNQYDPLRKVKDLKATNPYAKNIHSHILQTVVQDLDKAFSAFFRRLKAGETPGYPRFKSRDRFDSFGLKEYCNGFKRDGRRLRLTGIGRVRVRWHRALDGTTRIPSGGRTPSGGLGGVKTGRIVRQACQWYACFACEVEARPLQPTGQEIGVDVGLHHLIATSEGETVENPKWYRVEQDRLRVLQRRVSRRKLGGRNRRKAVAALQRQHARIANRRKDYLNKLAFSLVERYDRIALEDLQITNLVQNHHLARSIMDAGWGYLKLHLAHKAEEAGRVVYLVKPAQTSRTCSRLGEIFEGLTLSDRLA